MHSLILYGKPVLQQKVLVLRDDGPDMQRLEHARLECHFQQQQQQQLFRHIGLLRCKLQVSISKTLHDIVTIYVIFRLHATRLF